MENYFNEIIEMLLNGLNAATSWLSAFIMENSFMFFFFLGFFLFSMIIRFLLPASLRSGWGSSDRVTEKIEYTTGTIGNRKINTTRTSYITRKRR